MITYDLEAQTVQFQPNPLVEALLDCVPSTVKHGETLTAKIQESAENRQ
ncbi:hypothetical protein [Haladaptatus halobius]|nr:hypothetical protein [Haladaptatus halobius]